MGRPGAPAGPPPSGSSRTRLSCSALLQPRGCKNALRSSGIKERAQLRETSRRERNMGGPNKLPVTKGGEKMLRRPWTCPLPPAAPLQEAGLTWGEPAPPSAAAYPSLHPLLPLWCLYLTSCYKGSTPINNIKNHKETTGRVSRRVEETPET